MKEEGKMTEQITIRLSIELKEKLFKKAKERGYPITTLLKEIFTDYFSFQNIEQE